MFLALQAPTVLAQQDDSNDNHGGDPSPAYQTVYETVCHDEPRTASYETGNTTCTTNNTYTDKSADFGGSGSCHPEVVSYETVVAVCERVARLVPAPPVDTCSGAGSSCAGNSD